MNQEIPDQPVQNTKKDENPVSNEKRTDIFSNIKQITAWVMIISAILFALVGVLAIWKVFGGSTGEVIWRAFSSLAVIAFAAFIVNVASRVSENKH